MSNLTWHQHAVTHEMRTRLMGHKPALLWFTGLSGAGKSTVANALECWLYEHGHHTYLLDGDNIRHRLNKDLGFSDKDRIENIRRIGEVGKLFTDAGVIVLSAFISPFRADRQMVRSMFNVGDFIEIYVSTPITVCEERDPKGLYRKARAGQIKHFTGIDSPYEPPEDPEIVIDTSALGVEAAVEQIAAHLKRYGIVNG